MVWIDAIFFTNNKGDGRGTYHLESGEVFFPPNEFLILWTHGGHHVVKVHDDVDEGVEQTEKGRVTARRETNSKPDAHWHDAVVNDVQKRNVLIFLAQNEENLQTNNSNYNNWIKIDSYKMIFKDVYCVEKLGELGEIIPPAGVDHLNRRILASTKI